MSGYGDVGRRSNQPYPPPRDARFQDPSSSQALQRRGGSGLGGRGAAPRGSGTGRWRSGPSTPPPSDFQVQTNLFPVAHFGTPTEPGYQWHMYRLSVTPLKGLIKYKDQLGQNWKQLPDANPMKIERMKRGLEEKGSTDISRELFSKLSDELWEKFEVILATDFASTGVSNKKIPFETNEDCIFLIKVENRGFRVEVQFTNTIAMGIFSRPPTNEDELATADAVKQCLEIIFKYGLCRTSLSCDTNPRTFFLPEPQQKLLAQDPKSPFHRHWWPNPNQMAPFEGITQSARFIKSERDTTKGRFMMIINNKVDWLYRDCSSVDGGDIPILDLRQSTIAGVKIGGLRREVSSEELEKIEAALAKMKLKVEYQKGPKWAEERRVSLKARGNDDQFIEEYIKKHKMFKSVHGKMQARKDDRLSKKILFSCAAETFSKDGVEYDIRSYFEKFYDIRLDFPHLPVVSVGGRGYFPVEFLYQEKSRVGGNEKHLQDVVLKYHDHFSGPRRVTRLCDVLKMAYEVNRIDPLGFDNVNALLKKFQMSIEEVPKESPAKTLPSPRLQFGTSEMTARNGSWNLADKAFAKPADLAMPVILDFTKEIRVKPCVQDMIDELFRTMKRHGMRTGRKERSGPEGAPGWQDLIFRYGGFLEFDKICKFVKEKVLEARNDFLNGQCRGPLFTCIVGPNGDVENTWILKSGDRWFRIPQGEMEESHLIYSLRNPEQTANARIQFLVAGEWKDPSKTRCDEVIERYDRFKIWTEDSGWITVDGTDIGATVPYSPLDDWQIECPSMILCYISEVDTAMYNLLKTVCDITIGLNSQILVKASASANVSSNRLSQLCSNVALKVNTKLFNRGNSAVAWEIPNKWYGENPTIIMGYGVANGRVNGYSSTALAGSVCLFHPMQMGQAVKLYRVERRGDVVDSEALKALIFDLIVNYFSHTRQKAQRFVVYRDGGSHGSLGKIKTEEFKIIQEVFNSCFPQSGQPTITFVVSNKDHNINIVPRPESGDVNVHSGTSVNIVEEFKLDNDDNMGAFSFLLTAQGGLKGTSKPMLYTCLVNENLSLGLDESKLKSLTYDLSFQYGSATKSPRKVPVLLNSEKLANRALAYAPYFHMAGVDICSSSTTATSDMNRNTDHLFERSDRIGSQVLHHGLFPSFGVLDDRCTTAMDMESLNVDKWRAPFRAHITG